MVINRTNKAIIYTNNIYIEYTITYLDTMRKNENVYW